MIVQEHEVEPSFLNKYIRDMKKDHNDEQAQQDLIQNKLNKLDQICLEELEAVFLKHKTTT